METSLGPASDWRHPLSRYRSILRHIGASWSIFMNDFSCMGSPVNSRLISLCMETSLGPASEWRHPLSRYRSILRHICWRTNKSLNGDLSRAVHLCMWLHKWFLSPVWVINVETRLHEWFFLYTLGLHENYSPVWVNWVLRISLWVKYLPINGYISDCINDFSPPGR